MTFNRFLLNNIEIPKEIMTQIENLLPPSDQSRLALTSRVYYAHRFSTQLFFNTRIRKKCELVQKLLNHVVRGEQQEADQMLKEDPGLLLEPGMVIDYAGRTIAGTALQIALGAEDVQYHPKEECMAEMIERHLIACPNGNKIITTQIAEQFPEEYEMRRKESVKQDLTVLKIVFGKLKKAKTEAECEESIKTFSQYLTLKKSKIIREGKHFNKEMLIAALQLYDINYEHFGNRWDTIKNVTSWRKIIGLIQLNMTACYAQGFCQGYYYLVERGKYLNRNLIFPNGQYYYAKAGLNHQLGKEFAASVSIGQPVSDAFWLGRTMNYFIDYASIKSDTLYKIKLKYQPPTNKACCTIL